MQTNQRDCHCELKTMLKTGRQADAWRWGAACIRAPSSR